MMNKKAVLAYSGGLDTSFCVAYLKNKYDFDVHTVLVNTGGFTGGELEKIEERAHRLGATTHTTIDKVEEYYHRVIRHLIFGNVLKHDTYPLSVSAERVFQAIAVAEYANGIGADYLAHGSTGAGNDQIRFDLVFHVLAPDKEIITPVRDNRLSREKEVEYLEQFGLSLDWESAKYSINKGLWGTTVGGDETLTSDLALPEEAYPSQLSEETPRTLEIEFQHGEPAGIDGISNTPVDTIEELQQIASAYAIGRNIHVGDTIIGIKGRVGFEAAAPMIIIKAHHYLEKHLLGKWQLYWKDQLSEWYGMMLHEARFLDPVMRNIETFFEDTQQNMNGRVSVRLNPYRFEILGVSSEQDLMNSKFGDYGEMNKAWTAEEVRGFAKMLSMPIQIHQSVNKLHHD